MARTRVLLQVLVATLFLLILKTSGADFAPLQGFDVNLTSKSNETVRFVGWSTRRHLFIGQVEQPIDVPNTTSIRAVVSLNLTEYHCVPTKLFSVGSFVLLECQQYTTGARRLLVLEYTAESGEWSDPFVATVPPDLQRSLMNDGVSLAYLSPSTGVSWLYYLYARGGDLCNWSVYGDASDQRSGQTLTRPPCPEFQPDKCKYIADIDMDRSDPDLWVVRCSASAGSEFANYAVQFSALRYVIESQLTLPSNELGKLYHLPSLTVLVLQTKIQVKVVLTSGISVTYGVSTLQGSVIVQSMLQGSNLLYTLRNVATLAYSSYRMDLSKPGPETLKSVKIAEGCALLAFSIPSQWWLACLDNLKHIHYNFTANTSTLVSVVAWPEGRSFEAYVNYSVPIVSEPPTTPTPPTTVPPVSNHTPSSNPPSVVPAFSDFDWNNPWCVYAVCVTGVGAILLLLVGVLVPLACCRSKKQQPTSCSCYSTTTSPRPVQTSDNHIPLREEYTKQTESRCSADTAAKLLAAKTTREELERPSSHPIDLPDQRYIDHQNQKQQQPQTREGELFTPSFVPEMPSGSKDSTSAPSFSPSRRMYSPEPDPISDPDTRSTDNLRSLHNSSYHVDCTPITSATNSPTVSTRSQYSNSEATSNGTSAELTKVNSTIPNQSEKASPKLICASDSDSATDLAGHQLQSDQNLPESGKDGTPPAQKAANFIDISNNTIVMFNTSNCCKDCKNCPCGHLPPFDHSSTPTHCSQGGPANSENKDGSSLGAEASEHQYPDSQDPADNLPPSHSSETNLNKPLESHHGQSVHSLDGDSSPQITPPRDPSKQYVPCIGEEEVNPSTAAELQSNSTRYKTPTEIDPVSLTPAGNQMDHSGQIQTSSSSAENTIDAAPKDHHDELQLPEPVEGGSSEVPPYRANVLSQYTPQSPPPAAGPPLRPVTLEPISETQAATGQDYCSLDPGISRPANMADGNSQTLSQ